MPTLQRKRRREPGGATTTVGRKRGTEEAEPPEKESKEVKRMMTRSIKRKTETETTITTTEEISWFSLPEELLFFHILPRLPVKSLLRFRCVSKSWYDHIRGDDPKFVAAQLSESKTRTQPFIIFYHFACERSSCKRSSYMYLNVSNYEQVGSIEFWAAPKQVIWVVGYSNGLVCHATTGRKIEICNPSTHEFISIPFPSYPNYIYGITFGFGFDPLTNEYKVLGIKGLYMKEGRVWTASVVIYTLGSGAASSSSWRDISLTCNFLGYCLWHIKLAPVYVNGFIHWMARGDTVMLFDVHHEKFYFIQGPSPPELTRSSMFEMGGCLCVAYKKKLDTGGLQMNIYMLTASNLKDELQPQYHWRWVKGTTIILPVMPPFTINRVFAFSEQILFQGITEGHITFCNPLTGSLKKVVEAPDLKKNAFRFKFINHVENILSLKSLVPPGATQVIYVSSGESTTSKASSEASSTS